MKTVSRSALMPYACDYMYQIVNDVRQYPEFLPWCNKSEIHQQDEHSMKASLTMRISGLEERFTTHNRMTPGQSIDMELSDGPFEVLCGQWRFIPLDDLGCKVELNLQFQLKPGLASAIVGPAFGKIANSMVDSFCARARELDERKN